MTRCEKLAGLLPSYIDCALITSDVNRRYLSGMKSSAGYVIVLRDTSYLLIDFRYIEKAKKTVADCEVVRFVSLKEQLGEIIKKHNVKSVAVESREMTLNAFSQIKAIFPDVSFYDSDVLSDIINKMRAVKSHEEIEKIKKAQDIAEKSFDELLNYIKVGKSERELALFLDFEMQRRGSEGVSFDTISLSGKNTSLPHGVPSDRLICENEFLLFDFGAVFDGYHSDMTRTVCLGSPDDEMLSVYNTVLMAQLKALETVRAGITGKELDLAAREVIKSAGYGECFGHSLGHGVGLEIHESPIASPSGEAVLEENMIVTVEPGIYLPEKFGVRIEDFVQITPDGCVNITKSKKNLICL